MFTPDLRGAYLVELWLGEGVSEDLSERFDIEVSGMPPTPVITVGAIGSAGSTIDANANASVSPEHRPLSFAWRLQMTPSESASMLRSGSGATTSFVADVAGSYTLELDAFDGELWSTMPATATIQVP
jgi:hypothetical protein